MARTTFSGPVKSDNGFEGDMTSTAASVGTLTVTGSAVIGNAAADTVGFFGATPVVQPSSTGEVDGFTVGTGTAVTDDSTFTGDVGSKAYTIDDIVKHLKNLGLLAAS